MNNLSYIACDCPLDTGWAHVTDAIHACSSNSKRLRPANKQNDEKIKTNG